ncbi:hypothetical protein OH77DRAFT_506150 [Trametes cingulata]|nr:hypothetical protein OH77DRAFT_506150 [Trametes cingulata]
MAIHSPRHISAFRPPASPKTLPSISARSVFHFLLHLCQSDLRTLSEMTPTQVTRWMSTNTKSGRPSIHRLPNEIVLEVFRFCQMVFVPSPIYEYATIASSTYHASANSRDWLDLMLVCRAWRALGVSTPVLWTGIEIYRHLKWLALALERSGNMQVELYFHNLATARVAASSNIVLANISRLRKLVFPFLNVRTVPEDLNALLPLLRKPMAALDTFVLPSKRIPLWHLRREWPDGFAYPACDLSHAQFPALRVLHLSCASLPWHPTTVSRLRYLRLDACFAEVSRGRLGYDGFLEVLRACGELEHLELSDGFISSTMRRDMASDADSMGRCLRVSLTKLRFLSIEDAPEVVSWLVTHLELPAQGRIRLVGCFERFDDLPEEPFSSLLPVGENGVPQVPVYDPESAIISMYTTREITISSTGGRTLVLGLKAEWTEVASVWMSCLEEAMIEFSDLLCGAPIRSLSIYGRMYHAAELTIWTSFLSSFPELDEVAFFGPGYIDVLFRALQSTEAGLAGSPMYICPGLQDIVIEFAFWRDGLGELILETLQLRANAGLPPLNNIVLNLNPRGRVDAFNQDLENLRERLGALELFSGDFDYANIIDLYYY